MRISGRFGRAAAVENIRLTAKEELSFLFYDWARGPLKARAIARGDGLGLGGGNALGAVKFGFDVGNVSFREIFK